MPLARLRHAADVAAIDVFAAIDADAIDYADATPMP
jgi:hypothetical protein